MMYLLIKNSCLTMWLQWKWNGVQSLNFTCPSGMWSSLYSASRFLMAYLTTFNMGAMYQPFHSNIFCHTASNNSFIIDGSSVLLPSFIYCAWRGKLLKHLEQLSFRTNTYNDCRLIPGNCTLLSSFTKCINTDCTFTFITLLWNMHVFACK